ncbi:hypothetical protein scyTo_0022486, partial [Scyliorhinus torazame]|nr:hypothetical protein [Scyliorhinus torazame]
KLCLLEKAELIDRHSLDLQLPLCFQLGEICSKITTPWKCPADSSQRRTSQVKDRPGYRSHGDGLVATGPVRWRHEGR